MTNLPTLMELMNHRANFSIPFHLSSLRTNSTASIVICADWDYKDCKFHFVERFPFFVFDAFLKYHGLY